MPEPTSTATATLIAASAAVPVLTAFGVPLGLRADVLVAGFAGALVAITLLDSVPASGSGFADLIRTTLRRMGFALASSLTAGYLTPVVTSMVGLVDHYVLGLSFAVGGGAQKVMQGVIAKLVTKVQA